MSGSIEAVPLATFTAKPEPGDFAPHHAAYIDRVPPGNILTILDEQIGETLRYLGALSDEKALHRYAPGKWSIKEIVGHMADVERIMSYRGLRFARGDATPLPGFEQDDYVPQSGADRRPLKDLLTEFACVRQASMHMFRGFDADAWARRGVASDHPMAVRAVPFILAGHERQHLATIRERYL